MLNHRRVLVAAVLLFAPAVAAAHGFGRLYNLPVPFWLYGWAAAATLLLSFLLIAYFAAAPQLGSTSVGAAREFFSAAWMRRLRPWLRGLSVFVLLLCLATGFWGSRDPYRNFSMTFFWVVFVLGFAYLSALFGNFYAALNPWRVIAEGFGRIWPRYTSGRFQYPAALGDWPALLLYVGFIWYELFGHGRPSSLATLLLVYTAINLAGVGLFGLTAWFRHGEFFGVFMRLLALLAPLEYRASEKAGEHGQLYWRWPGAGAVRERPLRLTTVIFALAMLSTTAFDGLRQTQWWAGLFWRDPTGIVTALAGERPILVFPILRTWYLAWESFWLLLSPVLYFGLYVLFLAFGKWLARSPRPLRELALDFGYSLLPIALVYSMTHYSTLMLTQGLKIISLLSDPFGWGWNLFGTAHSLRAPILPEMGQVWHTQVGLILLGHVASVYLAHQVALRVFPSRRAALLSQLPMLGLMVLFTISGLWILAQPLTEIRLR